MIDWTLGLAAMLALTFSACECAKRASSPSSFLRASSAKR